MQPQRHLFLDLEDTIIEPVTQGWFKTELVNTEKVRAFIGTWKPTHVHLFSFALHNLRELSGFNQGTRSMLETALGVKLQMTPTIDDDILPACCAQHRVSPERTDFSDLVDFWGKQGAFRSFLRHKHASIFRRESFEAPVHVALLDDVVFDEDFSWPVENLHGNIRNVLML